MAIRELVIEVNDSYFHLKIMTVINSNRHYQKLLTMEPSLNYTIFVAYSLCLMLCLMHSPTYSGFRTGCVEFTHSVELLRSSFENAKTSHSAKRRNAISSE